METIKIDGKEYTEEDIKELVQEFRDTLETVVETVLDILNEIVERVHNSINEIHEKEYKKRKWYVPQRVTPKVKEVNLPIIKIPNIRNEI